MEDQNILATKWTTKLKRARLCDQVYKNLLTQGSGAFQLTRNLVDYNSQKSAINQAFNTCNVNDEFKVEMLNSALNHANELLLSDSDFEWISKNDPHLYLYCHYFLQKKGQLATKVNTNYTDCFSEIISVFDNSGMHKQDQLALMDELKLSWANCYRSQLNFKWFDINNEDQISWAWDYDGLKYYIDQRMPVVTHQDKYWVIRLSIDFWKEHPAAKREVVKKMKDSWNKFFKRSKNVETKQFNFVMDKGISEKLKKIVTEEGVSRNKVVEKLINDKFR